MVTERAELLAYLDKAALRAAAQTYLGANAPGPGAGLSGGGVGAQGAAADGAGGEERLGGEAEADRLLRVIEASRWEGRLLAGADGKSPKQHPQERERERRAGAVLAASLILLVCGVVEEHPVRVNAPATYAGLGITYFLSCGDWVKACRGSLALSCPGLHEARVSRLHRPLLFCVS